MEEEFDINDLTSDELISLYNIIKDFIEYLDKEAEKVGEDNDK